jgi:NTP pyrophosphatase (non-canonical NTP hydrolase)
MNFQQYKPLALRTEKPLATAFLRLEHACLGLATEGGEFTTTVKRVAIYGKAISPEFIKHMREELGDTLWYVAIACDALDFDLSEYQYLYDPSYFDNLSVTDRLKLISLRLSMETGFISFYLPNFEGAGERDSIMRSLLNIVCAVAHACDTLGFTIEEIMAENIAKLKERFPDAYSNTAAEARADKGGLDARNS